MNSLLTQELIEMATPSPIDINDLDSVKNGLRDEALFRLYQLVREGVFTSSLEVVDGETRRFFTLILTQDKHRKRIE
ncbi:unnamed protein product [marine sediment metagenome]|uniref:Uncharacterized protein n=1 Tax=marine sediment metagenome TaxID=412755 RepID=X0VMZ1_9ZZZZ